MIKNERLRIFKNSKHKKVIFFVLLLAVSQTFASFNDVISARESVLASNMQNIVSGSVRDDVGVPLPGVSVVIVGKESVGVTTDFDGNYEIKANRGDVLSFSYVGFVTKKVVVGKSNAIDVQMEKDVSQLDQIIVIGYGNSAKKAITASVASIVGDEIETRNVINTAGALQGALAGVSVTRQSSAPGADNLVRIRGFSSIGGGNEPLILVDNVSVPNLNDVTPDQIQSISVLKDAAAASIYGARASTGVILITTQRGEPNKLQVSYTAETFINQPTQNRRGVSAQRYMQMRNELFWNNGGNQEDQEFTRYSQEFIDTYAENNELNPDEFPDYDWADIIIRDQALGSRHSVQIRGGTDKFRSAGFFRFEDQDALYATRDYARFNGRLNNDYKIADNINIVADFVYDIVRQNIGATNPIDQAFNTPNIYAPFWQDGRIAEGRNGRNIYGILHQGGFDDRRNDIMFGKVGFDYKVLPGLKVHMNYAPRLVNTTQKEFVRSVPYWAADDPLQEQEPNFLNGAGINNRSISEIRRRTMQYTFTSFADYKLSLGNHELQLLGGYEEFRNSRETLGVRATNLPVNNVPYVGIADRDNTFANQSSFLDRRYTSFFGRFSYDYDGKYLLQGNIRRDGSSRFGEGYQWGNFPSLSLGWVASSERFLENLYPTLSFLKFRASYGELGNEAGRGAYFEESAINVNPDSDNPILLPNGNGGIVTLVNGQLSNLALSDITWETSETINFGLDLGLFRDKLSITADYYEKQTSNMILNRLVPSYFGFGGPIDNIGEMETKGWEVSFTWKDNIGEFAYATVLNLYDSKTTVKDIAGLQNFSFGGLQISEEGSEFREWYGYVSDGLYQTEEQIQEDAAAITNLNPNLRPGDIRYVDINEDGIFDEDDRTRLGGSRPRFQYGGTVAMEYKGFDFNMIFQGIGKQKNYLPRNVVEPLANNVNNVPSFVDGNYWSTYNSVEQNQNAEFPRLSSLTANHNYRNASDFWLREAGYFRVKNIALGYTVDENVLANTFIKSVRFYIGGNDIFSVDNFLDGFDPEQEDEYLITKSFYSGIRFEF